MAAIGELVLDVTIDPHGELEPGDDRDAKIRIGGGGQAANFCAWAASLGERARLIARVGPDEAGRRLAAELAADGVELVGPIGTEPTTAIAVLVGPGGERSFARQRGASIGLGPEDVDPAWLAGARLLHVPCYGLYREPLGAACRRAMALARAQGALLSLDLSSAADLRRHGPKRLAEELARLRPALLFATEAEAEALGAPPERLAEVVVTKLGARGCRVLGRRVPAPAVRAVDTSGAGDALAAAFCAAYLDGATPLEAAGRAVLVAARAVTAPGARP
jgi:sugar/nucleoside kinase (ribokinase family)